MSNFNSLGDTARLLEVWSSNLIIFSIPGPPPKSHFSRKTEHQHPIISTLRPSTPIEAEFPVLYSPLRSHVLFNLRRGWSGAKWRSNCTMRPEITGFNIWQQEPIGRKSFVRISDRFGLPFSMGVKRIFQFRWQGPRFKDNLTYSSEIGRACRCKLFKMITRGVVRIFCSRRFLL